MRDAECGMRNESSASSTAKPSPALTHTFAENAPAATSGSLAPIVGEGRGEGAWQTAVRASDKFKERHFGSRESERRHTPPACPLTLPSPPMAARVLAHVHRRRQGQSMAKCPRVSRNLELGLFIGRPGSICPAPARLRIARAPRGHGLQAGAPRRFPGRLRG